MEISEYPSVVGTEVEIRTDQSETKYPGEYVKSRGVVRRTIRSMDGARYYVVELAAWEEKTRFLVVKERYAGDSIPREFSRRPSKDVIVGVAIVRDEALLNREVFDYGQVDYFAIGNIRPINPGI